MIVVDKREPSEIMALLSNRKLPYQLDYLEVGDYIVGDIIIERKRLDNLVASFHRGQLWYQMKGIKAGPLRPLLVIEGQMPPLLHDTYSLWRKLYSLRLGLLLAGVPSITVGSPTEFVELLSILEEKQGKKEPSPRPMLLGGAKTRLSKEEAKEDMLCLIPTIGRVKAKQLLNKYHTIERLIGLPERDLEALIGKKSAQLLKEYLTT